MTRSPRTATSVHCWTGTCRRTGSATSRPGPRRSPGTSPPSSDRRPPGTSSGPHLPELARWDPVVDAPSRSSSTPTTTRAGRRVWASGLVALSGASGSSYEQAVLLYLLSLEGEAGHACPATCTIGLARALRRAADPAVRDRFLPALVDPDYDRAARGSQFLTEVQGGTTSAPTPAWPCRQGDGTTYRVTGEKWFCSVADAGQFFLTARVPGGPDGTRGLGQLRRAARDRRSSPTDSPSGVSRTSSGHGAGLRRDRLRRIAGLARRAGRATGSAPRWAWCSIPAGG